MKVAVGIAADELAQFAIAIGMETNGRRAECDVWKIGSLFHNQMRAAYHQLALKSEPGAVGSVSVPVTK